MDDILAVIFLIALVLSGYFLLRLVIRVVFGGETSGYKKKLTVSVGVCVILFALFFAIELLDDESDEDFKAEAEQKLEELLNEHWQKNNE